MQRVSDDSPLEDIIVVLTNKTGLVHEGLQLIDVYSLLFIFVAEREGGLVLSMKKRLISESQPIMVAFSAWASESAFGSIIC